MIHKAHHLYFAIFTRQMHIFHFANCERKLEGGFNEHPTPSLESILITTHGYSSVANRFWIISSRSTPKKDHHLCHEKFHETTKSLWNHCSNIWNLKSPWKNHQVEATRHRFRRARPASMAGTSGCCDRAERVGSLRPRTAGQRGHLSLIPSGYD